MNFFQTGSAPSRIDGERSRDREVADASEAISVHVEEQVKPSRGRYILKDWFEQVWRQTENRNARREQRSQNMTENTVLEAET